MQLPDGISAKPAEVEAQLSRILASPDFHVTDRVSHFLSYVVNETVAGRAERLKAFSIALEVFGRGPSFDAQNDPVVRIEASRLRAALERYYLTAGTSDPIVISIPKGGYTPTFARRDVPVASLETPEAAKDPIEPPKGRPWRAAGALVLFLATIFLAGLIYWFQGGRNHPPEKATNAGPESPVIVVLPFSALDDDATTKLYAAGLTEEIIGQLARFRELTVYGRETSSKISAETDGNSLRTQLGVRFSVEGAVRTSGQKLRVTSRLVDLNTGAVLWSHAYDEDLHSRDMVEVEQDVARNVATTLAQPYGIIFRADEQRAGRQQQAPPDDIEAYGCTLRFYAYRLQLNPTSHGEVRNCLEEAIARYPDYATAWAMLAYVYLDEDRFGFNPQPNEEPAIQRALNTARKAVYIDPANVRASQALMTALYFDLQPTEAMRIGDRALELNPNYTELLGEFGSRLAMSGHWDRGVALMKQALDRNPGYAGFYNGVLALAAYMKGDIPQAVTLIQQANLPEFPLYHVVAAVIYAEAAMPDEAKVEREAFLRMRPRFFDDMDAELSKRGFTSVDRTRLIAGARKAGFPVLEKDTAVSPAINSPTDLSKP
ncbi:adenylate cyclase [Kaistia terrae]|uniref:Adenylate cyclase n=1 Tax=Kaistia terrae TaxID=537017 RepID=A0ABW0Q1U6_9HYPH|nr:adenylate cyclase [Kaistia terrae]MCX5581730.1 adenylate cyclase [Kaistia terrae]